MSSQEFLVQSLDNHFKDDLVFHSEVLARFDKNEDSLSGLKEQLGSKVGLTFFITTMIALCAMQLTLYGYLIEQISRIRDDAQTTKNTVYEINGKLSPFDFIVEK